VEMKRPNEDEQDARLRELFRSVEPLSPSPGFTSRTMEAVRLEPLPAGRQALRHPWSAPLGWTVLICAAAAIAAVIISQPLAEKAFVSMLGFTLRTSEQLVHFIHAGLALSNVFSTVGHAVARAAATREGTMTLILTATVAGTSLMALQRLLFSEGEVSQWQELS
jgi:hypothetical protein